MIYKLASAIYNDVVSGLVGITSTPTISMDQLEQDVVDERLQIIKEYSLKNLIPKKDLFMRINCVNPTKESLNKCPVDNNKNLTWHIELPQTVNDLAWDGIEYIGTSDNKTQFKVYTSVKPLKYHKYKRRGCADPYVFVDTTPNCNNMYDGWVFNMLSPKELSFDGIIKDPRQLEYYPCCSDIDVDNFSFLSNEIKKRLTEKKLRFYRQFYHEPTSNTQAPK